MTENRSKGTLGIRLRRDRCKDILGLLSPHDVVDISVAQFHIHVQKVRLVLRFQYHLVHTGIEQDERTYLSRFPQ